MTQQVQAGTAGPEWAWVPLFYSVAGCVTLGKFFNFFKKELLVILLRMVGVGPSGVHLAGSQSTVAPPSPPQWSYLLLGGWRRQ